MICENNLIGSNPMHESGLFHSCYYYLDFHGGAGQLVFVG